MKHHIEWMICSSCGAHLYPPPEVSDMGQEEYEEAFEAPPLEPKRVPSAEELAEINRARGEAGLPPFASIDEWTAHYKDWAKAFRGNVRARAEGRRSELQKGPPKVRGLQVVEEAEAFKVKGKRWLAIYEETPTGWRLKCPHCGFAALEWRR